MLEPAGDFPCPQRPTRVRLRQGKARLCRGGARPPRIGHALAMTVALAAAWLLIGCDGEPEGAPGPEPPGAGGSAGDETQTSSPDAIRERIRDLARRGTKARPEIERFLKHPTPAVREEAALAYPRVADGTAAPALARLATSDPEADVRAAAVTALGHMRAMDEMEAILNALEDPDPLVRRRAADAASRITGQRYDVNVPPDEWRRTVDEIRALWQNHGDTLRTYHERRRPPPRR